MSAIPQPASEQRFDFEFACGPYPPGELAVLEFQASEELSQPFRVDLELVAVGSADVDTAALLGQEGQLTVPLPDGTVRLFHGLVAEVERWAEGSADARQRCRVRLVPQLWRLGQGRRSRIFQELSSPDIVQRVLKEAGVKVRAELAGTYPQRAYCVQYRESDLAFVSRLLEEAGIFYFFEHLHEDGHVMVLVDANRSCPDVVPETVPYREPGGMAATEEHVDQLTVREALRPDAVVLRDFDYLRPALDLSASAGEGEGAGRLEVYDFPGRYPDAGAGRSLARIRLEEERVEARMAAGAATVRALAAGHVFTLAEHPVAALNTRHLLVSVQHTGRQPELLAGSGDPDAAPPPRYRCRFSCLDAETPFRPARLTPRPSIPGPQTAIVVGPAQEEVFTDEHGRIKVQFHWDREGRRDERSSCWIRVSQSWAGAGYGALFLPRVGSEVVVEFLEGDPDAPVVIGSLYNGENPPPLALPDHKTRSTLRSSSSPGGGGFNELSFEDAAGEEEVYLHAERNLRVEVQHDREQEVEGHERLVVRQGRTREVLGSESVQVHKDDALTVSGNQRIEVGRSRSTRVGADDTEQVGGDLALSVGGGLSLTVARAATESVGQAKTVTVGGAYSLTVGGAMKETVGGSRTEDVSGGKAENVGGKKTEVVQGGRSLSVGGDLTETVDGASTMKVGKDLTQNVGGNLMQKVGKTYTVKAKELVLSAEDTFLLKVGSAVIEVKKGGDIVIKGARLDLTASGELVLKASTIAEN